MLTLDVGKRPTINKILNKPIIASRIKKFLEQNIMKEEFSHTILHKKQVILDDPEKLAKPIKPPPLKPIPEEKEAPKPEIKAPLSHRDRYGSGSRGGEPASAKQFDYAQKYKQELKEKQERAEKEKQERLEQDRLEKERKH